MGILVLQSVKPSVLEIFLLIIQVFKRLINLSIAIHFPDSVRKMRESCPGLTEQTPKGLTERSEVFQYDRMHECCALSKSSRYIQSRISIIYDNEDGIVYPLRNAATIWLFDRTCEHVNRSF